MVHHLKMEASKSQKLRGVVLVPYANDIFV